MIFWTFWNGLRLFSIWQNYPHSSHTLSIKRNFIRTIFTIRKTNNHFKEKKKKPKTKTTLKMQMSAHENFEHAYP